MPFPKFPHRKHLGRWFTKRGRVGAAREPHCSTPSVSEGKLACSAAHMLRLTDSDAGVGVGCLYQLFALMANDPVGINLSGALGVQVDHLEVPEVCLADGVVLRTHIVNIRDTVIVEVIFTSVPTPIACCQGKAERKEELSICLSVSGKT